jgi:hypothetical protein
MELLGVFFDLGFVDEVHARITRLVLFMDNGDQL